jgi:hypothetical protein
VSDAGVAVNDVTTGRANATLAEQEVVATVVDASVAVSVIAYVPGVLVIVCVLDVLPFPHTRATGATPPDVDAVHVIFDVVGTPTHPTVNADAAFATPNESTSATPATDAMIFRDNIITIDFSL